MKFRLLSIFGFAVLFLVALVTAVLAEEEPPGPYTGLENPLPWSDPSAQAAGKEMYQQSCLGCHGATGSNLADADFSAATYPQGLEQRPDFYFWILSEGRIARGMPPFKSSLSEEQRWQVITYLWSLGAVATPSEVTPPLAKPPVGEEGDILLSAAPQQPQSGQTLTLTAVLRDSQGKPVRNAMVKFFIKVDFFTSGLMEIGDAVTNDQGVAILEYTPRLMGDIQLVTRYEAIETATTVSLAESGRLFYQAEAGIWFPAPGDEVFIGPESALELGEGGRAPTSVFRPPSGVLSWLSPLLFIVIAIWVTYFYVIYQVFRIPIVKEIGDTNTRLIPLLGMVMVVALGILLVLMLITGPYTHFHLLR